MEQTKDNHFLRRVLWLLALSNLLFLVLVVVLAWCNRLCVDDFCALALTREQGGLPGAVAWYWQHWTGRWAAQGTIALNAVLAAHWRGSLFAYSLVTLLLVVGSLHFLLRTLWKRSLSTPLSGWMSFHLAIYIASLVFFVTFDRGQSWFWLSGSATYLWPLCLLLIAAALLLDTTARPGEILLATLLFALIPGFNENLPVLILPFLLLLLLVLVWQHRTSLSTLGRNTALHKVFWPLAICGLSTLYVYSAPGTEVRLITTQGGGPVAALPIALHATWFVPWFYLRHRAPWLALAVLLGGCLGMVFSSNERLERRRTRRVLVWILAGTLCAVFLSVYPSAVALHALPYTRTWLQNSFLFIGVGVILGFLLAQNASIVRFDAPWGKAPVLMGFIAGSGLTVFFLRQQVPMVLRFARRSEARYGYLERLRAEGHTRAITLPPLHAPGEVGWVNFNDIVADPKSWINDCYKRGLALPFDVRLQEGP